MLPAATWLSPTLAQAARNGNLIFRIPTPVFGAGLIELIPDSAIRSNLNSNSASKADFESPVVPTPTARWTITRFGWKAQNKSLEIFSGELTSRNGSNQRAFQERADQTAGASSTELPKHITHFDEDGSEIPSDVTKFAIFMRSLDQPQPVAPRPQTQRGLQNFTALDVRYATPLL